MNLAATFRTLVAIAAVWNFRVAFSEKIQIGDETFDYDEAAFESVDKSKPSAAINPAVVSGALVGYLNIVAQDRVMGSLETVLRESYKFIRLADDLHEIKSYLNDIRLCFIALTVSGYVGILLYVIILCVSKRRAASRRATPASDDENGWRAEEAYRNSQNRTPDPYKYSRATRNFQTTKLDSVDHPSLKHQLVVENHTGSSGPVTGLYRENGGGTVGVDRVSPT